MMSPIGKERELLLWQILTKSEQRKETFQDIFLELKEIILKINLQSHDLYLEENELIVPDIYIPKEVKEERVVRFSEEIVVNKKRELGSKFIKEIKKENNELENYLTYEHLIAENIASFPDTILLVGAHGSGKTYKLSYVWNKYLEKHQHCNDSACASRARFRILIDMLNEDFQSSEELYRFIYKEIFTILERELGNTFEEKYKTFLHHLLREFSKREKLSFISTLILYGLSVKKLISYTEILESIKDRKELELIVSFALNFSSWIEKNYYPHENRCIYIIFDNIDGTSQEVQRAIVSILEKKEIRTPMVCACRPETLRNWNWEAIPLLTIPHIGPSAYDVVMSRFEKFLNNYDEDTIKDNLKGMIEVEDFINNVKYILENLKSKHFENFFHNLFGWQIRQALRFAQGIVDAATSRTYSALQIEIKGRSKYALERIIYRPWGIKSPKLRVVNIFQQGNNKKYRLSGLRVLIFLHEAEKYTYTLKDIHRHLSIFGYSQQDTINVLQEMVKSRLVITATKEYLILETFKNCQDEYIRLTEMGHGFWWHSYELGYISTVMYYCLCSENKYENIQHDEPTLVKMLETLRVFLKEMAYIEFQELNNAFQKGHGKKYFKIYENKTIVLEILSSILKTILKIWLSEKKRLLPKPRTKSPDSIFEMAKNFESDFNQLHAEISAEYKFKPPIEAELIEIMKMLEKGGCSL